MRLYEDDFATAVYRTLRAAHRAALTHSRSRSVTHLAAPAFGGAMMGRQILGAIPVERRVCSSRSSTSPGTRSWKTVPSPNPSGGGRSG